MSGETYVKSDEVPHGHPACGRWGVNEGAGDYVAMVEALCFQLRDVEILQNHRHAPDSGWRVTFERYEE